MFGSLVSKVGVTLKSQLIISGESSSSLAPPAKYFLFTAFQNQNSVISNSRVSSIFYSFSTATNRDITSDSSSFVVSYLINSCGLTQDKAISASKKIKFKTTSNPDSVLALLRTYGFTESHISRLIPKHPFILLSNPNETLKPKLEFFKSKGLYEIDLPDFISIGPTILRQSLNKGIIPSFDILKSIVQSDENVIKVISRNSWLVETNQVKRVMVNLELLRKEGVPETNFLKFLIHHPRTYAENANRFKEIVQKV
ncbi:uncharacterized protein LOC113311511 [Papaver somniferum]|uniref:uncharacterized protein LOC113311511 n=1 Tax=Papaver somniferum TaxID=3469 RepID=UPI000E700434|nr:uncharacterized protein LOC113311511 [Papaver somniferum]